MTEYYESTPERDSLEAINSILRRVEFLRDVTDVGEIQLQDNDKHFSVTIVANGEVYTLTGSITRSKKGYVASAELEKIEFD